MAAKFEKLDKQLDRLEKLFSRKKRATESHVSTGPNLDSLTFPQPSYIRPTSSRMMAREEVYMSPHPHAARRAKSLPEPTSTPPRATPVSMTDGGSDHYSSVGPGVPHPSSSLYPDSSRDDPSSALLEFSFSTASKDSGSDSSSQRRSRSTSKSLARSLSVSVSPKAPVDRRRYSAVSQHKPSLPLQQEVDVCPGSPQQCDMPSRTQQQGVEPASREYLAPSALPRVTAGPKTSHGDPDHDDNSVSKRPISASLPNTGVKRASKSLRKSTSLFNLLNSKSSDPELKEPSVTDFLALSDDDIADGHAALRAQVPASTSPTFALPPNPPLPVSTPVRTKPAYPLLTLSPPLASRPATAAAFEAARIAAKYQLDLVYVVNLWPSHMSRLSRSSPVSQFCGTPVATSPARTRTRTTTPSPPGSPASHTSDYDSGFESSRIPSPRDSPHSGGAGGGVTGRLLAAYGLPSIMYPFRISAPVHQKVLRTQGWLEYRNGSGAYDEFARGYSCSFYTGHSAARGSETPDNVATANIAATAPDGSSKKRRNMNMNTNKSKAPNRGIVFAAFCLPRDDGSPRCLDAEELEALHRDAEALVDMLIDIHMTQRGQRGVATAGTPRRCAAAPGGRMAKNGAPLVAI